MIELILSKLEHVKQTGQGRWKACCPAHEDRDPSLAIKECSDGRVLVHCFSGCGGADVMGAIGLTLSDLYPDGWIDTRMPGMRRPAPGMDHERTILMICDADRKAGKLLSESDKARERLAFQRVHGGAK